MTDHGCTYIRAQARQILMVLSTDPLKSMLLGASTRGPRHCRCGREGCHVVPRGAVLADAVQPGHQNVLECSRSSVSHCYSRERLRKPDTLFDFAQIGHFIGFRVDTLAPTLRTLRHETLSESVSCRPRCARGPGWLCGRTDDDR